MEEIEKELQRLDNQIIVLQRVTKEIRNKYAKKENMDLDVKYLARHAKGNAFAQHITKKMDRELGYKYCCALASVSNIADNKTTIIKQMYYVLKIFCSFCGDIDAEEMIRDSKLFSVENWIDLINEICGQEKQNLFVDFLMIIYLSDDIQDKQLDCFCELAAFAGYRGEDIAVVVSIVKELLMLNYDGLLNLVNKVNINNYLPYMREKSEYYVVTNLDNILMIPDDRVMLYGAKVCDKIDIINIEQYKKKEIIFRKCCFENISGIVSKNTPVQFIDCQFVNCMHQNLRPNSSRYSRFKSDGEQMFFADMKNVKLERVVFNNCVIEGYKNKSSVFRFINSNIHNCQFIGCRIGIFNHSHATGAVMYVKQSDIRDCEFINCYAYGEGDYGSYDTFYMRILEAVDTSIVHNKFEKCECDEQYVSSRNVKSYIMTYGNNCYEEKNVFENCDVTQCRYSEEYTHIMKSLVEVDW